LINPQLSWGDSHRFDRDYGMGIFFVRLKVNNKN